MDSNKKIAVFGCGFVGSTTADWLEEQGHSITRVDPKLYPDVDPLQAVIDCSHIIICVPTPGDYDTIMAHKGQVDDRAIKDHHQHLVITDTRYL